MEYQFKRKHIVETIGISSEQIQSYNSVDRIYFTSESKGVEAVNDYLCALLLNIVRRLLLL